MQTIDDKKEKLWDIIYTLYRDKVKYDSMNPPSLDTDKPSFIPSTISTSLYTIGGLAIFNMLYTTQDNGVNCRYLFARYHSVEYETYLRYCPHHQLIENLYDPEKMYAIGICIPYTDEEGKNLTAFEIKIFDYATDQEILPKFEVDTSDKTNLNNLRKRK